MGKKGGSKHLKRLPAPTSWPIHRKEFKWVVKPRAGPHSLNSSLPLLLVVREMLGLVRDRREARIMLSEGNVKVDGKVRRSDDYPIGIMDVVEVLPLKKAFRVLPSRKELLLHPINEDEKAFKLCEVVDITTVKGHLQIHLHDGKNILVKAADRQSGGDVYNVHDLMKISIPNNEVLAHLKFGEGILGIVDKGKNMGALVEVTEIARRPWPSKTMVILKDREGNQFETILDYVFPIGKGEPWISIREEGNA